MKSLRVRFLDRMVLVEICLDDLNEVVREGKGCGRNVVVDCLRKLFERTDAIISIGNLRIWCLSSM